MMADDLSYSGAVKAEKKRGWARWSDGDFVGPNGSSLPSASKYDTVRGEARWTLGGSVREAIAVVSNTLSADAVNDYPARILIGFGVGEVDDPAQIEVLDPTGTAVQFQIEPATDPRDESADGYWSDGSLRAAAIWVLVTLDGAESQQYRIVIHPLALDRTITQSVVYTAVSGTIDQLQTADVTARFESGQAWNLRRYQDRNNSDFDLFTSSQGMHTRFETGAANAASYTAASVTQVSHGLVGADAYGYGVVFQDYETVYQFSAVPTMTTRVRYRVFADGSIWVEHRNSYSAALANESKRNYLSIIVGSSGLTATVSDANLFVTCAYTGSTFIYGARTIQVTDPNDTGTEVRSFVNMTEASQTYRVGWGGNGSINSGVTHRNFAFLAIATSGAEAAERRRRMIGVSAVAAQARPEKDGRAIVRLATAMATEVSDTLGAEWGGVKALMMLQAGSTAAACLAQYQAYCTSRSITPATASTYVDVWAGSEGLEFLGRNTQVLWWLREAFRVAGDSTNQTLVESYIHAWADACVTMESESGAAGLVKIRGSVSEKPWNAGASAAAGLAMSLAVTSNSTRDTALGRIISAFSAGSMGGPAWAIVSTRNPVQYPLVHYHAYTIFEMARVKKLLPAKTLSADSLIAYPLSMFSGNSKLNEWKANETYRRGASSTHLFVGAAASLFYGRHEVAYELSRHVALQVDAYGGADQMDGWDSSEASAVAMDVRALVEVARWL